MVRHWLRPADAGLVLAARRSTRFGAVLTVVVLIVVASVKFFDGAYLVVILIPLLVGDDAVHQPPVPRTRAASSRSGPTFVVRPPRREERAVVPVPGLNRAVVQAVNVARSIADDVRAVFICDDPDEAAQRPARPGSASCPGVPLVVVESPYRALVGPLVAYLDVLDAAWPPDRDAPITFVVPRR